MCKIALIKVSPERGFFLQSDFREGLKHFAVVGHFPFLAFLGLLVSCFAVFSLVTLFRREMVIEVGFGNIHLKDVVIKSALPPWEIFFIVLF